jgi:hypothetical protein
MTISQLLDAAIHVAQQQGYRVRHEHLGGTGSGYYQLRDELWLVLDVAQPDDEQLLQVVAAIKSRPLLPDITLPEELASCLK